MKEKYQEIRLKAATKRMIETINKIIAEYAIAGYKLTVRQLYYQLVARDIIPNTERSYKNTTSIVNDGRLAGLIDWDMIEDRTRSFIRRSRWDSPKEILESAASSFHMDLWAGQENRLFCIVEKEALVGVLERVCHKWDVPLLAARGYPSASVLREFAKYDLGKVRENIVILHLGDHDPSGIDMTRDLRNRIEMFLPGNKVARLKRIALTMDQVEEENPPPNPAKVTDTRFEAYREKYGDESWELDALPPQYLTDLVDSNIAAYVDASVMDERKEFIEEQRERILELTDQFND